ncbi:NAD-dependent epimerase/dehydratase family protein [Propionibacteriaceae bacterium Y1700]|uniref:NAD-dependent epimerase/dehydratase family protein n=1 Tax=Microlunatus sp. Y1700 TaxID=3418487 RepID=UPI003DA70BC3
MQTILVTGAYGKVGREVVAQLVARRDRVVAVDRRDGRVAGVQMRAVDLGDRAAVEQAVSACDGVIHLGAYPSPEGRAGEDTLINNVLTTYVVVDAATRHKVPVVLASSGSIYGTAWSPEVTFQEEVPVTEATPVRYVDPYALSKDVAERIGAMAARQGIGVLALRFHWVVTADEIAEQVEQADPAEGVRNLWGYVELGDAARACLLAIDHLLATPEPHFDTLLITAADTLRTEDTEKLIKQYSPSTRITTPIAGTASAFDCSRAADLIGWRPVYAWR